MTDKDYPDDPRVILLFPSGAKVAGRDPTEVLTLLGAIQWQPCDAAVMKSRLADRLYAWNRRVINPDLGDVDFLLDLDRSGMVAVEWRPFSARPPKRPPLPLGDGEGIAEQIARLDPDQWT